MFDPKSTSGDDWTILHSCAYHQEVDKLNIVIKHYKDEGINIDEKSRN